MSEWPRLTHLVQSLIDEGYDTSTCNYRTMRDAAVNRVFPAHQVNGIWHFNPEDTPAIATALRLKPIAAKERA